MSGRPQGWKCRGLLCCDTFIARARLFWSVSHGYSVLVAAAAGGGGYTVAFFLFISYVSHFRRSS